MVLTELKNRGLQDILIACVDGLKGSRGPSRPSFPHIRVQLCVVHMVCNSLRYVCWRDHKAVSRDLKRIYQAPIEAAAARELEVFIDRWGAQYAQIRRSWTVHWPHLIILFEYPPEIRRVIYTTNAIDSLDTVIRKATRQRKVFPSDDSAIKVVYLVMKAVSRKWTMPIQNWNPALNRLMRGFGDRRTEHQSTADGRTESVTIPDVKLKPFQSIKVFTLFRPVLTRYRDHVVSADFLPCSVGTHVPCFSPC